MTVRGRGRALGLGEAADVVDRLVERAADLRVERVAGRDEVVGVEDEATVRTSATDRRVGVAHGVVAPGADVGERRSDASRGRAGPGRRRDGRGRRGRARAAGSPAATAARSSLREGERRAAVALTGRSSRSAGRGCPRRPRS